MVWTAYQVTFRLLSPMHIGWRRVGNLQQTRPYVTGRNLWGALTERLVCENGRSNYTETGKQVDEQLAFSYFYPSAACDTVTLWPWGDTWDEFAWAFLDSYASTALEQEQGRSAAEGSLHETEYIAPYTRALSARSIAAGTPVYLVGYIFVSGGCQLGWRAALDRLQIGGERGYGWGRLSLKSCQEVQNRSFFGLYELDCMGDRPLLTATGGSTGADDPPLLAHVDTEGQAAPTGSDGRP
jgi:hypothetical protein